MKVLKEKRGTGADRRRKMVGAKLGPDEIKKVDALAARHAGGKRAKWARVAMLKFRPSPEDFK